MGKPTMSRLDEPEDEMCEPTWPEPLELTGVGKASSTSSTPASEIDPATLLPSTSVGQMSRFFALRLATVTASKEVLGQALAMGVLPVNDSNLSWLHG